MKTKLRFSELASVARCIFVLELPGKQPMFYVDEQDNLYVQNHVGRTHPCTMEWLPVPPEARKLIDAREVSVIMLKFNLQVASKHCFESLTSASGNNAGARFVREALAGI